MQKQQGESPYRLRSPPDTTEAEAQYTLFSDNLPYVTQFYFRAGNRASGQDFGRILIGKTSNPALRPAEGPILKFS